MTGGRTPMRIGLVATLSTAVRPRQTGSVEQVVWLLANEYSNLGHDVTVYACAGSDVPGSLVETVPGPYGAPGTPGDWRDAETVNLCRAVSESARFDVLHSHVYLWGLPLEQLSAAPMVHTAHVMPYDCDEIVRLYPQSRLTALSTFQWSVVNGVDPEVVPHGVDPAEFRFVATNSGYLCYVGRFLPDKGVLIAIDVARRTGVPLRLAGPENEYYTAAVAPLVDGDLVEYVGWVSGEARVELMSNALGLIHPLQAPEPFGLVLVEAMMCGTPVLATARGASLEIVETGVTGYLADDTDGLAACVGRLASLDRGRVRQVALDRFSSRAMAQRYLAVYDDVLRRG